MGAGCALGLRGEAPHFARSLRALRCLTQYRYSRRRQQSQLDPQTLTLTLTLALIGKGNKAKAIPILDHAAASILDVVSGEPLAAISIIDEAGTIETLVPHIDRSPGAPH